MSWTIVNFGKHEGKTLPQIIFSDADWFFWAVDKNAFKGKGFLEAEAVELDYKVRNIHIPKQGMKAEYYIHRPTKKFDHMSLVPKDQSLHQGSGRGMQKEVIDLSIPGQISRYDKSGYKRLLFSVKLILFGDEHIRMTKERCEKFFDDDENFEIDIITRQWLDSILPLKDEAQKIICW